jgi:hypothetical protein
LLSSLLLLLLLRLIGGGLLLLLLLRLIKGLLLLRGSILVDLHVLRIVVTLLKVLDSTLPDITKSGSGVFNNAAPGRLSTEELDTSSLGGQSVVQDTGGTGDTIDTTNAVESVVAEDVLSDERATIEDHDGLASVATTVSHDSGLREYVLLELVAPAVVDRDLDLLHNKHNGADIAPLVRHVALAEEIVQVVVEAVVDLVNDKDLLNLLHNLLLAAVVDDLNVVLFRLDYSVAAAVVDNLNVVLLGLDYSVATTVVYDLEILLLNLNDLLLLVEVVEAVDEVECAIVRVETVDDRAEVGLTLGIAREGDRGVDGLGGCKDLVSVFLSVLRT